MKVRWILPLIVFGLSACAADGEESLEQQDTQPVCEGSKCDGISDKFKDAYSDMKEIDLEDLTVLGVGFASDELNDKLSDIPFTQLALEPVALYGAQEEVLGQTTVHDLNGLRVGLTDRLGEKAFATRVIEMRRSLADQNNLVWAESRFEVGPDLGHSWGMNAGDVVGTVGFNASATVETVVIAPHANAVEALKDNPLEAIKSVRGFVVPRKMEDVSAMRAGESLAMTADGALGLNLGVGVPFMIATFAELIALHARLSFGARVALSGKLDVQLVRGEANDVWVDVGMRKQQLRHFSVAATTGFGVQGLPKVDLDLGPLNLDVAEIAEKALKKQLNKRIAPSANASTTRSESRMTVARFRFDLSFGSSEDFEQALAQAMRGDIRLAQAMANNGESGVVQELDLLKDSRSEGNYLGFRFLGMEFYRANNFDTGTVQIEADGNTQTLLFSELDQKSGLFFTDRDMAWRKLVSLKATNGRLTEAEVNARITLKEQDKFLTRDQMLDHIDSLVGYFIGFEATFAGIGLRADELGVFVDDFCGRLGSSPSSAERREFRECLDSLPTNPAFDELESALRAEIALVSKDARAGFDPEFDSAAKVASDLLTFKVVLSRMNDRPDVLLNGPEGTLLTQIRFSDDALHGLMIPGRGEDFRTSLAQVLQIMAVDREDNLEKRNEDMEDYIDDRQKRIDEMGDMFDEATLRWADLDEIATVTLNGQTIGDYGSLVTIPVKDPDALTLASVAEHKGDIIEQLVPDLVDLSDDGILRDLDEPGSFVVGYSLLWMVEPSEIEFLSATSFDEEDAPQGVRVYSRGTSPLIDAGQFNIETLLGAE